MIPAPEKEEIPANRCNGDGDEGPHHPRRRTIAMNKKATSNRAQCISASTGKPTETTIRERIGAALDHATPFERAKVIEILDARGSDELTAGDVFVICDRLEIAAALLLCSIETDLAELDAGEMLS